MANKKARSPKQIAATKKLVAFNKSKKAGGGGGGRRRSGGSSHNTSHRRKRKTRVQRALTGFGIFPLAPTRLLRSLGYMNLLSSMFLGKDVANNFKGVAAPSQAQMEQGTARKDIVDLWMQNPNVRIGTKMASTYKAWISMAIGTFRPAGFRRAVAPALIGEVAFQGAKALRLNQTVPPAIRPFIRWF